MDKLNFVWKNCGMIRRGFDISNLTIELTNSYIGDIKLVIDAEEITIKDNMYNILNKEKKLDIKSIFQSLDKIKLPEQTEYNVDGCDGDAWELDIDGKKYSGYLNTPKFLKEILDAIKFRDVYSYAKNKLDNYVKIK